MRIWDRIPRVGVVIFDDPRSDRSSYPTDLFLGGGPTVYGIWYMVSRAGTGAVLVMLWYVYGARYQGEEKW